MSNFRRIFKPTKEERIQDLELILRLHNEQIGNCSTCVHKAESNDPGFVTDYGYCRIRSRIFHKKVLASGEEPECPNYKENIEYLNSLKKEIQELQKEGK